MILLRHTMVSVLWKAAEVSPMKALETRKLLPLVLPLLLLLSLSLLGVVHIVHLRSAPSSSTRSLITNVRCNPPLERTESFILFVGNFAQERKAKVR